MKKTLLLLITLLSLCGYGQVVAVDDSFTVLQASTDTFDVVANDTFPVGDSVCISLLDSNARFTVLDCRRVVYVADSFYTGMDSIRYVVCDTGMICDTGIIIISADSNSALLPIASFDEDLTYHQNGEHDYLFRCNQSLSGWDGHKIFNTSQHSDSILWACRALMSDCSDSVLYLRTDTIIIFPSDISGLYVASPWGCGADNVELRLTAYNKFGIRTICDTSCALGYLGIPKVSLPGISLFPSPASSYVTIDMEQNTDAITSHYSSIDLINTLGQKVRSIPRSGNNKTVQVNMSDMPEGIYMATITDDTGTMRTLGRFTVER
ncbi:MAG: T9SS type A sorting domain-containing protein [Bacteroidetes bacterium]|nr:T9SS type A sorting domain-containing protein [Bacteroidota bacterium]